MVTGFANNKMDGVNLMKNKKYEIFEEFFRNSYMITRRMTAFYGITQEELKQEVAIVYFENQEVEDNFVSGNKKEALRIFTSKFRQSIVDFSLTGMQTDRSSTYERDKAAIIRLETNSTEEFSMEEEIMMQIELERLKEIYGDEAIDDVLEYYELGYDRYAKKHGISGATARTRISRRIAKIREKEVEIM